MNETTAIAGHVAKHTGTEKSVMTELGKAFEQSPLTLEKKLQAFPRHVRRQDIARFLVKYEIFKEILPVAGSIVECGVMAGGGLFAWSHFSSILEPFNHTRRVFGFDTFAGFPSMHEKDNPSGPSEHLKVGGLHMTSGMLRELEQLAAIHDRNRPVGHIPKVQLVAGDACVSIPRFLDENPHVLLSLLYLDFDLYEPTKAALHHLLPRVVAGGVIAFDELNCEEFPGETAALMETIGLGRARLRRLPMDPYISWFTKE